MKVVVNAIPLLSQRTGIGRYIYSLFNTLLHSKNGNEYLFFYGKSFGKDLLPTHKPAWMLFRNGVKRFVKSPHPLYHYFWRRGPLEQFDLYHETNYVPFEFKGKIVANVFDLSVLLFPESHPKGRRDHFAKYFHDRIDCIDRIITPSNHVKEEINRYLGIPSSRIRTIPLAPDGKFFVLEKKEVADYLEERGYPRKYILYVGTIEPRKNITGLIKAFYNIRNEFDGEYHLMIAGPKGWLYGDVVRFIQDLDVNERIHMPGYVPENELPYLYAGAELFVYPSFYEGFGLPPLEAMSCGVPVITSNCSSLPEVLSDAPMMVDPHREDELTEAMRRVLSDPSLREGMRERGLKRAKMFSWEKTAKETFYLYEELLSLSSGNFG